MIFRLGIQINFRPSSILAIQFLAAGPVRPALGTTFGLVRHLLRLRRLKLFVSFLCLFIEILIVDILEYFGIFWNTLEHFGIFLKILECFGVFLNVLEYSWMFWNIPNYFEIFLTILEYSSIFWNVLQYFGIFWNILEYWPAA